MTTSFHDGDVMRKLRSRREILLGSMMLTAAGIAAARMPDTALDYLGGNDLEKTIPTQFGRWKFVTSSGLVVPTEDQLSITLYSQMLTRIYWDGIGPPIMLLIAYGRNQTGFLQVHRPEICYTAAGYQLGPIEPRDISFADGKRIAANRVRASRDGMSEWLLYWTRIGNHIPSTWAKQRLAIAQDNLDRIIPDAVLVRASAILPDGNAATQHLNEFLEAMIGSVQPSLRRAFIA